MDKTILKKYLEKAAKQSLISFRHKEDEEQFLSDFQSALVFAKKLDEIDVSSAQPLENVLDFYGGNYEKMREVFDEFNSEIQSDNDDQVSDGFERLLLNKDDMFDDEDDSHSGADILKKTSMHMKGNLVMAPGAFNKDDF